jgi:putative ATPase
MKELGYGEGYRYDPDAPDGIAPQRYLPPRLAGKRFYRPGSFGFEKTLAERMEWFERRRGESSRGAGDPEGA